jgi:hypothetical protein
MAGVASVTESVVGASDSVTVTPVDISVCASVPTVTTALASIAAISRICLSFSPFPFPYD